nr:RNA-directed DNA polymerase [Ruegeria sp. HKCCA4008]
MLLLADRLETAQGDTRHPHLESKTDRVVSYGNRLFCDREGDELRHRWGSAKLYRGYFEDYRSFLERPDSIAEAMPKTDSKIVILQSDLKQFYDRVSPELLHKSLRRFQLNAHEAQFFDFACGYLDWTWHQDDGGSVDEYKKQAELDSFERVCLPQGLVASGFFANAVLLQFDETLTGSINEYVRPGVRLIDCARYVDDIRLVLSVEAEKSIAELENELSVWMDGVLDTTAPGLETSKEKTVAAVFRGGERPVVSQSQKMRRIQSAVSGGFDATGGSEILGSILGLIGVQKRLGTGQTGAPGLEFLPVPDVKDETVDRFAAARFRSTYRSLRPLLYLEGQEGEIVSSTSRFSSALTRQELDEEVKAFAYELVSKWIQDPSNVRLLRIGLDLWPDFKLLRRVLDLLSRVMAEYDHSSKEVSVASYCLAEVFRAGAVETAYVDDDEKLPSQLNVRRFRAELYEQAKSILQDSTIAVPWYLAQQARLLLATSEDALDDWDQKTDGDHYERLQHFLAGNAEDFTDDEFATFSVLVRRSFRSVEQTSLIISKGITAARANKIAKLDPDFGAEMAEAVPSMLELFFGPAKSSLGYKKPRSRRHEYQLAELVLTNETKEVLRNEYSLISFASAFLEELTEKRAFDYISPSDVYVSFSDHDPKRQTVDSIRIERSGKGSGSLYSPPDWCQDDEKWRFQLGYLLRFILTARRDFTKPIRASYWKEFDTIYRPATSHWYQRFYGLYSGHSAFGDDWLPISEWIENLLFDLLKWPGCPQKSDQAQKSISVGTLLTALEERANLLEGFHGKSVDVLPISLPRSYSGDSTQPLRACVIQTVIPGEKKDFQKSDLTMSNKDIRVRHRRHLSAALSAVSKSLELRETHKDQNGRLDLLILPELAVHPADISTHIVPFMRKHRTTVVTGLTYDEIEKGKPLVNSALWILPMQDANGGFRVQVRRQGKGNLAPEESKLNSPTTLIRPFRPCQWLVGYQWTTEPGHEPLWLTASICYDATDLNLAADLREHSDVYLIPALNKDVGTFDQMAQALHYHMFQMVLVANNGLYGGSNAYAPFKKPYKRQVFHMHGQPQASIAFLEIDRIADFKDRHLEPSPNDSEDEQLTPKGIASPFKSPPASSVMPDKKWTVP